VEDLGVSGQWRTYCRDRAAFERVRETAVSRGDPGTAFIFAPVSVAFSSSSVLPDAFALGIVLLCLYSGVLRVRSVCCRISSQVLMNAFASGTRLFDEGHINNAILALETEVRR
jgi:hypothetical protein